MSGVDGVSGVGGANTAAATDTSSEEFLRQLEEMGATALFPFAMEPIQEAIEEFDKDDE